MQLTATGSLSGVDPATRVNIGHEMCADLDKYHGDGAAAHTAFAEGDATWTPQRLGELQAAATTAYCTKYR